MKAPRVVFVEPLAADERVVRRDGVAVGRVVPVGDVARPDVVGAAVADDHVEAPVGAGGDGTGVVVELRLGISSSTRSESGSRLRWQAA
jgi:hypothetical protein